MIEPVKNLNGLSPVEDWIQHSQWLEQERDKWRIALESLTPNGSEFVNDLPRCLDYIQRQRNREHTAVLNAVKEQRRLLSENTQLLADLESLRVDAKLYRDAAEGMVAAFDTRPEGEPEDITHVTRECAMSVAKKDLGWACAECGKSVSRDYQMENFVRYSDTFIVCKQCHDQTERDWQEDKAALRAEGHKIPCDTMLAALKRDGDGG